jgi:hypothetical protein
LVGYFKKKYQQTELCIIVRHPTRTRVISPLMCGAPSITKLCMERGRYTNNACIRGIGGREGMQTKACIFTFLSDPFSNQRRRRMEVPPSKATAAAACSILYLIRPRQLLSVSIVNAAATATAAGAGAGVTDGEGGMRTRTDCP